MAVILLFPCAIEHARGRLIFARMAWRRLSEAEATEENFPAYREARTAYVAAWAHFRAIARL